MSISTKSILLATAVSLACLVRADLPKVTRQPYRWNNVEIVGGGFVSGILYHPAQADLVYARTDIGGAYRWNPKTKRWIPLMDWIQRPDWNLYGVESIGLDPTNPKRLYIAAGTYTNEWGGNGAILRSSDQGRSFQRTDMPFKMGGNMDGRSIGERLAVDPNMPNILYFGSRDNGLWRSSDFGATWTKQDEFPIKLHTDGIGICFEVFDTRSGRKQSATPDIYAGAAGKGTHLFRSRDAGKSWSAVPGQPNLIPHHAAFDTTGSLILTYSNGPGPNGISDGAVWKLNPKSDVWTNITPDAGKGFGYAGLSLDAKHPGTMAVTTLDRWSLGDDVFRTTDGGAHWTGMKDAAKLDSSGSPFLNWGQKSPKFGWWMGTVAIDPYHPDTVVYGTGATIWGCSDASAADNGGATHWTVRAQGLEETASIDLVSPPVGAHLFSGLGDIGGFRHDDLTKVPPDGMATNPLFNNTDSIDFAESNPMTMARVGRGGGSSKSGGFSTDGGKSWTPFLTEPKGARGGGHIAVSSDGATFVWNPERLAPSVSTDHGATWTLCQGCKIGFRVFSDRVNPKTFYAFDPRHGDIFRSVDGGASFTAASINLPTGGEMLRVASHREGDLWLASGNFLMHSEDGGTSFKKIDGLSLVSTVGLGMAAPGKSEPCIYVIAAIGSLQGAFRSDDGGSTWICLTDAQHGFGTMDQIVGDPRIYGRVYIGTNGRGVLFGDPIKN